MEQQEKRYLSPSRRIRIWPNSGLSNTSRLSGSFLLMFHPFFSRLFRWLDHREMVLLSRRKKERLPTTEESRKFITALCMCSQAAPYRQHSVSRSACLHLGAVYAYLLGNVVAAQNIL